MSFAATPPTIYGTLARYYVLPADLCHPIPDEVSYEDGAMIEPLAVGVHSVSTLGQCTSNQSVVVFGCGPVGLLCMAVAKALGARRVVAVDINQERLEFAKTYAATDIYIPVSKSHLYRIPGLTFRARSTSHITPTYTPPELQKSFDRPSVSLLWVVEPLISLSTPRVLHPVSPCHFISSNQRKSSSYPKCNID